MMNFTKPLRLIRTPGIDETRNNGAFLGATSEYKVNHLSLDNLVFKLSVLALAGEQQQRLCGARAIAVEPIILMIRPASELDPVSTLKIGG